MPEMDGHLEAVRLGYGGRATLKPLTIVLELSVPDATQLLELLCSTTTFPDIVTALSDALQK
jgi:hypothetical protein